MILMNGEKKEHIIQLNVRAWDCKIKSNIQAELKLVDTVLKLGSVPELKLFIEFDPEDLPSAIEIDQDKGKHSQGFSLKSTVRVDTIKPELTVDVPLQFGSGETGKYRLEINFRHAEYGTELAVVQPVSLTVSLPNVDIQYCRTSISRISKGQTMDVMVGLNFPAEQKLRGILFGRLVSDDDLVHSRYELEPKRISIEGEKEIIWHLTIPHDETKTGKLKAMIEFKSKAAFSQKEFEDVIEIRQNKLLQINSIKSSTNLTSVGDDLELVAALENVGLEKLGLEVALEVAFAGNGVDRGFGDRGVDGDATPLHWSLPVQKLVLDADEKQDLQWPWSLPAEVSNGKYTARLTWKEVETGEANSFSEDVFEVRKYHKFEILNAVTAEDSFIPDSEGIIKIMLTDSGTRAGEAVEVVCQILDLFNQELYKSSVVLGLVEEPKEHEVVWPVPANLDGGKYDLVVTLRHGSGEDASVVARKFSKLINIELPVRLDLQLILPDISKPDVPTELGQYLLENEEFVQDTKYKNMDIYRLNSNTNLFLVDGSLINYSQDKTSQPSEFKTFIELLFGYLITRDLLTPAAIERDLNFWSRAGFCWARLVSADKESLKIKFNIGKSKTNNKNKKVPGSEDVWLSAWHPDTAKYFKTTLGTKSNKRLKLSSVFKERVLKNKNVTSSNDFKVISSMLKFFIEYDSISRLKVSGKMVNKNKAPELKGLKAVDQLDLIYQLLGLLQNAGKFRKATNSEQLQNKFNKLLSLWSVDVKKGHARRQVNSTKFQALGFGYYFLLSYLVTEIVGLLKRFKREGHISPVDFSKLIMFEIAYYLNLANYYHARTRFDPSFGKGKKGSKWLMKVLPHTVSEVKGSAEKFWSFHAHWQSKYINYLKNMWKRADLAFIHQHVKITTNPVILRGLRGDQVKDRLILGNNGARAITLDANMALPSVHWSLTVPEARVVNNLYNLKLIRIKPKQTKEIPITISFPSSLSFGEYKGILKLNPKPFELN